MRRLRFYCIGIALAALAPAARATTFRFDTDPFAGTDVVNVPGRQVIAGEDFVAFDISRDVFSFEASVFGAGGSVSFINAPAGRLPTGAVNIIVLETFDDDNNLATPFNAGTAANVIADHITTSAPGFFIYFNRGLNVPRLVYSTDLSSKTSDLKVLARLINLPGETGREDLLTVTAGNFDITNTTAAPETSSVSMTLGGLGVSAWFVWRRRCGSRRTLAQQS